MNLPDINPKLPCLRTFTYVRRPNRQMSWSINPKNTYSTSPTTSSNKSKNLNSIPTLIQLCISPDENYSCRTMRILFSSHHGYSVNVCDDFGCNILMYSLRYQRYRLFEFLLNEISFDLGLHAKDQHGNTILHYAVIYGGNDTQIMDRLIEKYNKFAISVDERNNLGFTPLLLAAYCGRYDHVLVLLTKTDASPFVRDHIRLKNMFDYVETNIKHNQTSSCSSPEPKYLRSQLHQTIPCQEETLFHTEQQHIYKNFFEIILPRVVYDQSESLRSLIMEMFDFEYLSSNLIHLRNYLNHRYPRIKIPRPQKDLLDISIKTKLVFQQENSKTNVHDILNLFDPNLRPKMIPPPQITTKGQVTFKRLGTKLSTLNAFSRMHIDKKHT